MWEANQCDSHRAEPRLVCMSRVALSGTQSKRMGLYYLKYKVSIFFFYKYANLYAINKVVNV